MTPEERYRHERALADVNGDRMRGVGDVVALAVFVIGLMLLVAWVTGHVTVTIR